MNKLFVSAYRHQAVDDFANVIPAPMSPSLGEYQLDITHEAQQSEPFPKYTSFVLVKATGDCCIAFGEVADPSFHFMSNGEVRFYGTKQDDFISVIGVN